MSRAVIHPAEVDSEQQKAFSELLEKSFNKQLTPASVVAGEVIEVTRDQILVDIGGKYEGVVNRKEIPGLMHQDDARHHYKVGQILDVFILSDNDEQSNYVLSIRRVDMWKDWEILRQQLEDGETLEVRVSGTTRGGLLVQVRSLKGFIPVSQLRIAKTPDDLVGDVIPAKLLEVDRVKHKLILSHRAAVMEAQSGKRQATLERLTEGQEVSGEVVKITDFGAFVDVDGIDGLLPLSEISWRRLTHPSDVLSLGEQVDVRVLTIDRKLERISLSKKRLTTDPWESVQERFKEGDTVNGTVSKMLNSGFLTELEPGIEAFCSYNQVSRDQVIVGDPFHCKIISIVAPDRRITVEPVK